VSEEEEDEAEGSDAEREEEEQADSGGEREDEEVCVYGTMLTRCWYECGSADATVNISTGSKLGQWVCTPCYAAHRAFKVLTKDSKLTGQANTLKRKRPELFKARVRGMRLVTAEDLVQGQEGVLEKAHRFDVVQSYFEDNTSSFAEVFDEEAVLWLKVQQYCCHLVRVEGFKDMKTALLQWELDIANVDIARRGEGADQRLAVLDIPRTISRNGKRQVTDSNQCCYNTELLNTSQ
jgi:hypothetical protein